MAADGNRTLRIRQSVYPYCEGNTIYDFDQTPSNYSQVETKNHPGKINSEKLPLRKKG